MAAGVRSRKQRDVVLSWAFPRSCGQREIKSAFGPDIPDCASLVDTVLLILSRLGARRNLPQEAYEPRLLRDLSAQISPATCADSRFGMPICQEGPKPSCLLRNALKLPLDWIHEQPTLRVAVASGRAVMGSYQKAVSSESRGFGTSYFDGLHAPGKNSPPPSYSRFSGGEDGHWLKISKTAKIRKTGFCGRSGVIWPKTIQTRRMTTALRTKN